jgi:hypothetical protein
MPTSEATIACGVLLGRKPDAFSDRPSQRPADPQHRVHVALSTLKYLGWSP